MNVLMLIESLASGVGGIAIHGSELANALHARGHEVTLVSAEQFVGRRVVTRWRARRVATPTGGLRAWELPFAWTPRRTLTPAQVAWRWRPWLRRLANTSGAQILHWHGLDIDCELTNPLPRGCAGVFTNHSSQFLEAARVDPAAVVARFRHAHDVIAPSQELADATVLGGFARERVHAIPNGVDVDRYRPSGAARASWRARHHIEADAVVTVAARRIVPKNGLVYLARAAAEMAPWLRRPVVLCFVGAGTGSAAYEAEVREVCAGVGDAVQIRWLPWVASDGMPALLAGADIAVLPSLVEATSLAGLEAMASGCVLLGTRTGGIPELIDDGTTGRLVPPADAPALAVAWRELIEDPHQRRRLAANARERVEREFSWHSIAARTQKVYEGALTSLHSGDRRHGPA